MHLADFIDASNEAKSPISIVELVERAAADRGFDRYAYCSLTRHEQYIARGNPAPAIELNFPTAWTDHYFQKRYASHDPVVLHAPELDGPFLWDWLDSMFGLDPGQRSIMREAREAKLMNGVGIPLHGAFGNVCLMTFAASGGHSAPDAEMRQLNILAAQFHLVYSAIGRVANARQLIAELSARERECLQWISLGKTTWDIGMILNLNENTVKYHVKKATKKLDAYNRTQAVVTAMRYGLISLDSKSLTT